MQRKLALNTGLSVLAAASLLALSLPAQAQRESETAPVPSETRSARTWIVQLADAPLASYDGRRAGLAATRPAAGQRLDLSTSAARAYQSHLDTQRSAVLARVPGVRAVYNYSVTFNGFAAVLTEAQAAQLATLPEVRSVVPSEIRQLDTTRTTEFIGVANPGGVHSMTDAQGRAVKGEDVILGIVDSGIWPESPAFSDKIGVDGLPVPFHQPGTVVYGPAPAGWTGGCSTGEGFNPSMCNNKLIGARVYGADFTASGAIRAALEYNSPREGATSGHGTHTASTAGGNNLVPIRSTVNNVITGFMSGVAPRARIAAYKVCWTATVSTQTGCYTGDMLAAIDQAVADGVNVINFSISGTQLNFLDPVEQAFLAASNAGVFVSASAGNSGPGNTVAHMSPWLITVGNSTHDRSQGGSITLGNGTTLTGGSTNFFSAPNTGLVLSNTIAAEGVPEASANNCLANSLSSAAAGKIVVCALGTNSQAARLAMGAEVARAGGVGLVITAAGTVNDPHTLPALQLSTANATTLRNYVIAEGAAASGALSLSINLPGVVAPIMSNSSSRGPNRANPDILKPDITGPGSSIIASGRPSLTTAQRNEVAAGTLIPPWGSATLSGTSMSSPHVAGSAALLRQMFPSWSPAAIKSALTTSNTVVRVSGGGIDSNRWGYGSGHLHPNGAIVPSLVYDAGAVDYGRFLCGLGLASPASIGSCATLGSIKAYDLNLASLTASSVVGQRTLTRTVKNVGASTATFVASTNLPGFNVSVNPSTLTLAPGESASYTATLQRTTAALESWVFGSLAWSDGVRTVTSPLSARARAFSAPAEVSAPSGGRNARVFGVESSFTGTLDYSVAGLVPADTRSATISTGQTQCYAFTVPEGAAFARFQTFNSDTQGGATTDLDIEVFRSANCTGTNVGTAAAGGSDEVVTLDAPIIAGSYSVRVTGYATPAGGAAYTLSGWVVGPASAGNLRVSGPTAMAAGGTGSVVASWTVAPGARYMASIGYRNSGGEIGRTKLLVDAR
jgi:hypothetical protein